VDFSLSNATSALRDTTADYNVRFMPANVTTKNSPAMHTPVMAPRLPSAQRADTAQGRKENLFASRQVIEAPKRVVPLKRKEVASEPSLDRILVAKKARKEGSIVKARDILRALGRPKVSSPLHTLI
jgi:hypothetical protein